MTSTKQYCFYDFEATNINPVKAHPLELGVLITKDLNQFEAFKIKIKFEDKPFNKLNTSTKNALIFNNIKSQEDLNNHNKEAIDIVSALKLFTNKILSYFNYNNFILVGYNNKNYDNKILTRFIKEYLPGREYIFQNNTFDMYQFLLKSRTDLRVPQDIRFNHFRSYENRLISDLKQLNVYKALFNEEFKAHDSLEDVKALFRIFNHYKENFDYEMTRFYYESNNQLIESNFISAIEVKQKCQ